MKSKEGALIRDFTRYAGDTLAFPALKVKQNGVLVDIADDDFHLRAEKSTGAVVFNLGIGTGITLLDDNTVKVSIDAVATAAAPLNIDIQYWLRWTRASDGLVRTMQTGIIRFTYNDTPSS